MSGHCHHHHDNHGHNHGEVTYDKAFLIAISANSVFVLLQIIYAYLAKSTSLFADACHNLGDVLGLIFAWMAMRLMQKKATNKATYGWKKTSILAALVNGGLLIFTCGIIVAEAISKLILPTHVEALSVMVIAGIGIVVNGATAFLFMRGADDLNIKGAYLHLLYDAFISIGVVISAALLYYTGWLWIDPLMGLLIALIILKGTWFLFADSFRLIIDAVPKEISWKDVNDFFLSKAGVQEIHDLHIWALSTQENAISVHLYMPEIVLLDEVRSQWVEELEKKFRIQHATIQVERIPGHCNECL